MDNKNKKVVNEPNLRFPGFEGEWETKKLEDICTMQAGKFVSASDISETQNQNLFPCYGGNGLRGFTKLFNKEGKYPLIGRQGALCGNVMLATGKFYATEHAIVVSPNKSMDSEWMFYLLKYLNLNQYATGMAQPGLSVQNLIKIDSFIPKSEFEQQKISAFLSKLDSRIETQIKIIEELEALKKNVRDKLFKQQIKFKNIDSSWVEKKLGDILVKNSTKNKGLQYSLVQSVSNKYGFINQDEMFDNRQVASKDTSNYYIIKKGHFAYNPSRINVGSLAYKNDDKISIVSPLYVSFHVNQQYINDSYLLNWFSTEQFSMQMNRSFEGSVRNTLNYESLIKMKISLPSLNEQISITKILSSIENKIEIEKIVLEKYQNQKKYLLKNLFI